MPPAARPLRTLALRPTAPLTAGPEPVMASGLERLLAEMRGLAQLLPCGEEAPANR